MSYWTLVEPVWDAISIYDGPETFLDQYAAAPEAPRVLFAAHWCQSEVRNGGLDQFFFNPTGVLAPEAVAAFRRIGMSETAALIEQGMSLLGATYPRDQEARAERLELIGDGTDDDQGPFDYLDERFFQLIRSENGGFEAAADAFAAANV